MTAFVPYVSAQTLASGRFALSARNNHFITDATISRGGKGEALLASELFLSSLVTCGLALVSETARAQGLDDRKFSAEAFYEVDPEDGTRFKKVTIAFVLDSLDEKTAASLLKQFTDSCPIYNTVARDTQVDVTARTDQQPKRAVA